MGIGAGAPAADAAPDALHVVSFTTASPSLAIPPGALRPGYV
jgi:hypothetical protein